MLNEMTHLLRCTQGHEWRAASGDAAHVATPAQCPVCGAPAQTLATPATLSLPTSVAPASSVPTIAGYEVLEELGRGGMGIVYKAQQTATDRIVALKVILRERLAHPEVLGRFRREAQAAARLSHPNIVALYDYDQDGDTWHLAMEYVPGITLQRLVDETGPLTVELACDVVRQTALALQHAAEQALVHRDIKPSNLMLVRPAPGGPGRPRVKVLDMGVARLYQLQGLSEESLTTLTRDGAVIGTPDFVAPEQLEDPHGADVRADLYSLGCTFYFLLTGKVPFPGGTLIQKLDRQRWESPPSVDQVRRDVPAPVAAVVRRLMAKHPDDRYRSAGELAAALEQLARTGVLPAAYRPGALTEARYLRGHCGPVMALAFTPDGRTVVSGGADRVLHLWDVASGAEKARVGQTPQPIGCLAIVPQSGHVFAGQGVSVRLWDVQTGVELARLSGHTDAVRALAVGPAGEVLSGGDDRSVRLWDLAAGRERTRLAGHRTGVTAVAFSPDGRLAVSASKGGELRLWDLGRGREARAFAVPRGAVLAAVFSPDGRAVLSAHFDTTLRLWEVESGRELRRFSGHRQMVGDARFTPAGLIVSCSHDQTVRIWDPDSGAELWCGLGHSAPVTALAVAPEGRLIASAGADETVRLWELPP